MRDIPPDPRPARVLLQVSGGHRRRALERALDRDGHVVVDVVHHAAPDIAVVQWPPPAAAPGPPAELPWVAIVGDGSAETAQGAVARGAADWVLGATRADEVSLRVTRALAATRSGAGAGTARTIDVLDALPSGVAVLGVDGTVSAVNQRLCDLAGCMPGDVVGTRAVHEWLLGSDVARITGMFSTAMRDGRASDVFEADRDGVRRTMVAELTATRDDTGRVGAYMLSLRPRNERERVADALGRVAAAAAGRAGDVCAAIAREGVQLVGGAYAVVLRSEKHGMEVVAGHGVDVPGAGTVVRGPDPRRGVAGLLREAHPDTGWVLTSPLRSAGGIWGLLAVAGQGTPPHEARQRLERFAQVSAIATASLGGVPVPDLDRDPLTGLLGNRAFFAHLNREFERCRGGGEQLALALIDLDGFRRVNDALGRVEGDRVLAVVAERLRAAAGRDHVLGRLGGEEFGWLMPHTAIEDAFDVARAARQAIAQTMGESLSLTATLGVSEVQAAPAESVDELRQQAEVALHWAKLSGGNRCVSYSFRLAEQVFARKTELAAEGPSLRGMRALAWAVDARDPHTHRHSIRVADLAVQIAVALGWDSARATQLREAGLVHDVGKIAVPDRILFKPTRLNAEEFALVTRHPVVGAQIVADVLSREQAAWVRGHHERWDGRGYPDGLAGEQIPAEARVLALADAWDVMTSVRAYKAPVTLEGAVAEVRRCSGTQFWPAAVRALERLVASGAVGTHGINRPVADVLAAASELAA